VSDYPEPRRVVLTLADTRRLTVLERARACALAGVAPADIGPLLRAVAGNTGDATMLETGVTILYAIAYQLERRRDPALTWETAQTWELALDLETRAADAGDELEAEESVDAAIATGLPPDVAGNLTMAQLDAYRKHGDKRKRGRRSRRAS
jgi:hypothetical protein